jgi:hypothetical protein
MKRVFLAVALAATIAGAVLVVTVSRAEGSGEEAPAAPMMDEAPLPSHSPPPSPSPKYFDEASDPEFTGYPELDHYAPDETEADMLARMLWGEARGVASDMEKAACVWAVFNRVDDPRFPDTVAEVLEEPCQFNGYDPGYPITDELREIAADVWERYHRERDGEANAGRVLPREYVYFTGDGERNYFTTEWDKAAPPWDWSFANPYNE